MLNQKSYLQLLTSLRNLCTFVPSFRFSDKQVPSQKKLKPAQQIVQKLSTQAEKILDKTYKGLKPPKNEIKSSEQPSSTENSPKRKLADMVQPKKPQKEEKFFKKNPKKKEVDPQTVYLNVRQKHFRDPIRQQKYFREDIEKKFLNEKEIQQKLFRSQGVEQILRLYHGQKFNFTTKNLVTTVQKLAKFLPIEHKEHKKANDKLKIKKPFPYKTKEKRIQSLLFAIDEAKESFAFSDKMIVLWALTRMRYNELDVYIRLVDSIFGSLGKLTSDHLCLLAWCLSRNGSKNPKFYGMISLELEKKLKKMRENGSFMLQEAYIKENNVIPRKKGEINMEKPRGSQALEEQDEEDSDEDWLEIEEFEDREDKKEENLSEQTKIQVEELPSAQSISLVIWSFCKQNVEDEDLFKSLDEIITKDIEYFSAQQLMNILYGYNKIGRKVDQKYLEVLRKRLQEADISTEKSLTIKNIVSILNKLGVEDSQIYTRYIAEFLKANRKGMSPRFTCEILRVLVERKIWDESFFSQLNNFLVKNIRLFNLEDCMSSFESYMKLKSLLGKNAFKNENFSIRTTLDIIVTRMIPYTSQIDAAQKRILKKLMEQTNYNNKELENLIA